MELFNNLINAELIAKMFPSSTFFNIEVTEYSIRLMAYSDADFTILKTLGYTKSGESGYEYWTYNNVCITRSTINHKHY